MTTDPPPADKLDAWHRAALAETMRPCPEYRALPADDPTELAAAQARREGLETFWGDDPIRTHLEVA